MTQLKYGSVKINATTFNAGAWGGQQRIYDSRGSTEERRADCYAWADGSPYITSYISRRKKERERRLRAFSTIFFICTPGRIRSYSLFRSAAPVRSPRTEPLEGRTATADLASTYDKTNLLRLSFKLYMYFFMFQLDVD